MLRKIRILLALLVIVAITLLFVDFSTTAAKGWGWLASWQVVPALLAFNFLAIIVIAVVTLLIGRAYCSVLCPLGILQDIIARIHTFFSPRRRRMGAYKFAKARTALRITVLAVFVVIFILGFFNVFTASLASLVEPYSAYGRIASQIFAPGWDAANNWLADWSASHDNYWFYQVSRQFNIVIFCIAAATLLAVGICAWLGGRIYCNTICPVGTMLGFLSRHAWWRPTFDPDLCNGCRSCERHCKAQCIDAKAQTVDMSRCVACMDCLSVCPKHGLKLRAVKPLPASSKPVDAGRRNFLSITALAAGAATAMAADKLVDGGLTPLTAKAPVKRAADVLPPGAGSLTRFQSLCTACQLCVQTCPQNIIKPRIGIDGFMQPQLDFTAGYCLPECTACSDVCPTDALRPLTEELKSSTKIGTAVVDLNTCIAATDGTDCGNCERHCPAGAITICWLTEADDDNRSYPAIDTAKCIGCGACEYHCPVGSVASTNAHSSAIHVDGANTQRTI